MKVVFSLAFGLLSGLFLGCAQLEQRTAGFDTVILGGCVMDPETGLDAVRSVGIRDGVITEISVGALVARTGGATIDARGLVVAPGFIDLHSHGFSDKALDYRARDGVTTALELEWGMPDVSEFLDSRVGKARIHFGCSVSHGHVRALAMPDVQAAVPAAAVARVMRAAEPLIAFRMLPQFEAVRERPLDPAHFDEMWRRLNQGLREGGIGVGMAHQYYPGASRLEILRVFQFAADNDVPIFVHVRAMNMAAIQEVIANAASTGAALHIVHVNSMGLRALPEVLELIGGARERGVDVSTETYPYTAASTGIGSAIFDDGWQDRLGISYGELQREDTGERLTAETFAEYRKTNRIVIMHMMQEEMIELALRTPFVMVASDAMPYASGAHPRSAGTCARVLGRYVRERGTLPLMDALRKLTIMPAQRLEPIVPTMQRKGRVQVGADADLVVFDPNTVADKATFEGGLSESVGIPHVLVLGQAVVRDGELVAGSLPGRPVVGRYAAAR